MVKLNRLILFLYLIFVAFGLLSVTSSSVVDAYRDFGNQWQYFFKQLSWTLISFLVFIVVSKTSPTTIFKYAPKYYLFIVLLLLVVLFSPAVSGAKRWLDFGIFSIQPSEFFKSALILYLPYLRFYIKTPPEKFLAYGLAPALLILAQPDLGTAAIIVSLVFFFYILSDYPTKLLIKLSPFILLGICAYTISSSYRLNRLKTFINASHDPQGNSYQSRQSIIGIGSGGLFGLGIGQSRQKYNFLPEGSTDSIFSIIAEETGSIGSSLLIFLYVLLIMVIFRLSSVLSSPFHSAVTAGVGALISVQSLLNLSALTGLLPLTGVPLPFISYGGSSFLNFSLCLGVISSFAKHGR